MDASSVHIKQYVHGLRWDETPLKVRLALEAIFQDAMLSNLSGTLAGSLQQEDAANHFFGNLGLGHDYETGKAKLMQGEVHASK